ncbi:hypothetical protein [Streptomyces syringium]|uniref:hypothetical protein n=1 Tax=Streptomyces syringium TaxID=76729 RepID=UPI0034065073
MTYPHLAEPTDIWSETDTPIKDHMPDWRHWFTEEEASKPDRRPWRGWSRFPATSPMTAVEWLEREARKIPNEWHILGAYPDSPVPSVDAGATDRYLTRDQVLDYMRERGRDISISTWSSPRSFSAPSVPKLPLTGAWTAAGVAPVHAG